MVLDVRELGGISMSCWDCVDGRGIRYRTYPFLTPSICKSTHHIPGIPKIHHNAAFLPSEPIGSHAKTMK